MWSKSKCSQKILIFFKLFGFFSKAKITFGKDFNGFWKSSWFFEMGSKSKKSRIFFIFCENDWFFSKVIFKFGKDFNGFWKLPWFFVYFFDAKNQDNFQKPLKSLPNLKIVFEKNPKFWQKMKTFFGHFWLWSHLTTTKINIFLPIHKLVKANGQKCF